MKFELYKNRKKQWHFRIRADNGKILCHSEAYSSKRNARHAVGLIFKQAWNADILDNRLK